MRSMVLHQPGMFSYVSAEQRTPADHPTRKFRMLVVVLIKELDPLLAQRYAAHGRPSIPRERLLSASLLQVIYSVRSERVLIPAIPTCGPIQQRWRHDWKRADASRWKLRRLGVLRGYRAQR
jgi:hypothetical protein